jgi:hypothetical protein
MNVKSIFTALLKGNKLANSVNVKKATIAVNVITAVAVGASHTGIITLSPDEVNEASSHIVALLEMFWPYILAGINAYSTAATTDSIGVKKK